MMDARIRKAYDDLDLAISKLRQAIDPAMTQILGDWAMVVVEYNIESPEKSTYSRLFRGGSLPYHVAVGLFETALELTQENGSAGNEEEE